MCTSRFTASSSIFSILYILSHRNCHYSRHEKQRKIYTPSTHRTREIVVFILNNYVLRVSLAFIALLAQVRKHYYIYACIRDKGKNTNKQTKNKNTYQVFFSLVSHGPRGQFTTASDSLAQIGAWARRVAHMLVIARLLAGCKRADRITKRPQYV